MNNPIIPSSIPWGDTYKPIKIVLEGQVHDVKICKEGTPISEEEAWHTIMMRISQIQ